MAFWSPLRKCFLKMYPYGFMGMSPVCESGELPQNWESEVFKVEKSFDETYAFYNACHGHFIKMFQDGRVGGSPYVKDGKLPDWWRAELFKVNVIL